MPSSNLIDSLFSNNFLFFKPRDIVSGDFYFLKEVNSLIILAIGDCTGHGVPGAMMSMLVISTLNDIIRKTNIKNAAQVLEELREHVKTTLQQTGDKTDQLDGMDITFIAYDTDKKTINFAGANNPLVLFRDNELTEIKGGLSGLTITRLHFLIMYMK